jgi:hypothetical protein
MRHHSIRVGGVLLAACAALALPLVASASASAQAPAWRIDALTNTNVAPGDTTQYFVEIANIGDAPTSTPADPTCDPANPPMDPDCTVLTITVPAGLTVQAVSPGGFQDSPFGNCTGIATPGPTSVVCAQSTSVGPMQILVPQITVAADPGASGTLTTSFEVSGGEAGAAGTVKPVNVSPGTPGFGVSAFDGQVSSDAAGDPSTQAGGHPYAITTSIDFDTTTNSNPLIGPLWPVEAAKDTFVDLPPGLVGDPQAAERCTVADLSNSVGIDAHPLCSPASQVGVVTLGVKNLPLLGGLLIWGPIPLYNVVPESGVPARFGFNLAGDVVLLDGQPRSGGDYGLTVHVRNISEALPIASTSLTFWGVPADSSHDRDRACPGQSAPWWPSAPGPTCTAGVTSKAFLRNPTSCSAPTGASPSDGLTETLVTDSWVHPGRQTADGSADLTDPNWKTASFVSHDPPAYPYPPSDWGPHVLPTGCEKVPFKPSLSATPGTTRAGSPSPFTFDLSLPQSDDPNSVGEGDLRKAVVTLPVGVSVSPSSADGLQACSPAQIGLLGTNFGGDFPVHFNTADPTCPDGAKLGTVTIHTPLLSDLLTGTIYLAAPHDNPSGTLLGIYLFAKADGVVVKLSGRIDADPSTGQLTATFDHNPQLPFDDLKLSFDGGPRAALTTPPTCGTYGTHAVLISWSGKKVPSDSSFNITANSDGTPCSGLTFSPGFSAGTKDPVAGADTSFLLDVSRGDRDQELGGVTVDMPSGITGRIANAVLCPDGPAAAGTCTSGSQVGTIAVGAGAGSNPFWITNGRAYLTGPYKGAPFGLSMVVPAIAGPFDLGNVVVRAAIYVDKTSARLRVVSDSLPTILQGIPLDLREVRVAVDRPHFIVNPTSCAVKHVYGTLRSTLGAIAHGATRFQVGECANLPLAPKLTLTVGGRGHTGNGRSTPLTTTLTQTPGQANLRTVSVVLPKTLNARLDVLNRACTQPQFEAGHCAAARAGSAVAVTPLLRDPLRGSAYFVRNPHRLLPDLVVALRGQVNVDLVGKVGVNPRTNQLTTRFDTIPDVPITKFTLRLVAGPNGPLGVVANLCNAKARRATAAIGFRGQNGKLVQVHQRLRVRGCSRRHG